MEKSSKKNRCKSQKRASTVNSGSPGNDKRDLFSQISIDMLKNLKTWEEMTTFWMKATDSFCHLKGDEIKSEAYLQLAETILLAIVKVQIKDQFSRSMICIFEAWENLYDAVIEACSQDSVRCCTFAIKLANHTRQLIACEEMDCRLLFIYSHIIRIQIEYFNYDIINDVFVGDFDLSGKGNVLDSFCNLLIEIRRHSLEIFLKHTDKQTGIALELMSKSVLNVLEAATSLLSLMAKPAHVLFVIGALSEFMSNSLALVTEKGCRIFCKSQTNVIALVKTALITLQKHYSGPYDSSLLSQLEPIFIKGLRLSRLRCCLINFWQQTFGRTSRLHILDELSTALEQAKCASVSFGSERQDFSVTDNSKTSISCEINRNFSMDKSNDVVDKNQSPVKNSQLSPSKRGTMKHMKDENSEEYAVIDVFHSEKKMKLTDHQKEKLMGRSNSLLFLAEESQSVDLAARIPPGYTDSSSQENTSATKETPPLENRKNIEYNCVATSSTCVQSKSEDLLNENNNVGDRGRCDNRITTKHSVVQENTKDDQTRKFNELCAIDAADGQDQTDAIDGPSSESAVILVGEHVGDIELKILEKPTLSIRCKTPETAESYLEGTSPKENADEPVRTPNSILKKCGKRATCPAIKFFSASAKRCKRVHFDASTLDDDDIYGPPRRKIFRRSRNSLLSGLSFDNCAEPTSPSKRSPILSTNKNPADAVFPTLVGSEELIPPQIYLKLAPAMSSLALRSLMKSRGVATIGDLACMSEQDIETFPFRDPKLTRFLRALEDHFRMKNMVSKEDAIELEKIMKRRLNSPATCLKEVHLQPAVQHEAEVVSSNQCQELRIIDAPETLGKTATETSENEVSKIPTKHNYMNLFQKGSKRFTPYPAKHLDNGETNCCSSQQSDLKNSQIIPSFEIRQRTIKQGNGWSRFGFSHPFIRNQELINESPATMATREKSDTKSMGSSSLSEHDSGEERLAVNLPLPNENIKSCESNDNMNNEKPEEDDQHYDYNGSLRDAYRAFLENSVVASLSGIFTKFFAKLHTIFIELVDSPHLTRVDAIVANI
ncbi:unnamed protein product [Litomosoides sigmodontis]|uniref:Telomere-associated protein Rif1 N-terminal domain-containing protein n=1 Tax=Litomosoides sigmodontis TaxID=42156 RepID=A0A3P6SPG5_LITSI|nr:unnamed protein product [Litomosoides sigmodontis]